MCQEKPDVITNIKISLSLKDVNNNNRHHARFPQRAFLLTNKIKNGIRDSVNQIMM